MIVQATQFSDEEDLDDEEKDYYFSE